MKFFTRPSEKKVKLSFHKNDLAAVAFVLVFALAVFAACLPGEKETGETVKIYLDGKEIASLPLDTDAEFPVKGDYTNVVTVKSGKAAITQSDCPGADCTHTGWTNSPSKSIICLPNRTEVIVTGEAEVDFVVR